MQKRFRFILVTFVLVMILSFALSINNQASAHATLEQATPQIEGVVKDKPDSIQLKFNEPVYAKYSGITLYDDEGKKIADVKPSTSGSSATLSFSADQVQNGTNTIEWHAMSADGHLVSNQFQFSVGKVTAGDVDTSVPFFEKSDFWFGVMRYISEGAIMGLIGLFWVSLLAKRKSLPSYEVIPHQKAVTSLLIMGSVMTIITYFMTLTSDVLADFFTFELDSLVQFPFVLTFAAIIILLALMMLPQMATAWYVLLSIATILALSMSGHAWAQNVPLWSIIIRFIHISGISLWIGALIYLCCYVLKSKHHDIPTTRQLLFKVNVTAVAVIIISGVLMAIDETNILRIWQNIQTWSALLIVKVVFTLIMMILGFYQTSRALKKQHRVNKVSLFIELAIGIILIAVGIVMSQINLPT